MRAFAAGVELRLYRNGDLKQSARQSDAIWDFDEILRRTQARAGAVWDLEGRSVRLPLEDDAIPARTGLLGGTPDGTIFHGVNRSAMLLGLWDWLGCGGRSEEHTSELQSLMRISYAVFCLKKKKTST